MPLIDIQLVTRKIKSINEDLARLKNYQTLSFSEYLKNDEKQMVVERLLEKIVGRLIDINYHILREEYEILPEDYYQSFIEIGKKIEISEDFAIDMAKSTGLRNALAHEYESIDPRKVYDAVSMALTDIPKYLTKILDLVEK